MEIAVSAAMLGALLVIINQMVVRLHKQSAALDNHRFAQQTLENLLEEFTAQDWSRIETASIPDLSISELAKSKLQELSLEGEVQVQDGPLPSKRVRLQLSWLGESSIEHSLKLTTWVYQRPEE